jgi:hypothetical protein
MECKEPETKKKFDHKAYKKTEKYREYHKAYMKKYNQRPGHKVKMNAHRQKEEYKALQKVYMNSYNYKLKCKKYHQTPEKRYKLAKSTASRRGLEWGLSFEVFEDFCKQVCHYCHFENSNTVGVGLDRLDNSKGYILGNVVPCCGECNVVRADNFTPEEMEIIGKGVAVVKSNRLMESLSRSTQNGT